MAASFQKGLDVPAEFRNLRETVLQMVAIVEDPNSTRQDQQRACVTIRAALENAPSNDDGRDLTQVAVQIVARDPLANPLANEMEPQEAGFAKKLRELMKSRGITQAELAARVGCTQPAISQMLRRECRPQRSTILGLAEALSVDPRELWRDLEVTEILDSVAAVQEDQPMSDEEAEIFQRACSRQASAAPVAPLPQRKR